MPRKPRPAGQSIERPRRPASDSRRPSWHVQRRALAASWPTLRTSSRSQADDRDPRRSKPGFNRGNSIAAGKQIEQQRLQVFLSVRRSSAPTSNFTCSMRSSRFALSFSFPASKESMFARDSSRRHCRTVAFLFAWNAGRWPHRPRTSLTALHSVSTARGSSDFDNARIAATRTRFGLGLPLFEQHRHVVGRIAETFDRRDLDSLANPRRAPA